MSFAIDWQGDVSCREDIVFRVQDGLCTFTGACIYFGLMAAAFWTFSICFQLFMTVVRGVNRVEFKKYLIYLWVGSLGLPLIMTIIVGALDKFAYSISVPYGVCFIGNDESLDAQRYSWLVPSLVIAGFCFLMMIAIVYKVANTLFTQSKKTEGSETGSESITNKSESEQQEELEKKQEARRVKKAWKKMLWYNQKSLSFVLVFCLLNTIASGVLLRLYDVGYDEAVEDIEGYFACLLGEAADATLSDDEILTVPGERCGSIDAALSIWPKFYYAVLWVQLLGVSPLFVYGVKGKLKGYVDKMRASVRSSIIRTESGRETNNSSRGATGVISTASNKDLESVAMIPIVGDVYVTVVKSWRFFSLIFNFEFHSLFGGVLIDPLRS